MSIQQPKTSIEKFIRINALAMEKISQLSRSKKRLLAQ